MQIGLAMNAEERIINFFKNNMNDNFDAVVSEEFFCPFGVRAAVKRRQMIIGVEKNEIVAAMRYYPRKRVAGLASLYQFAIDEQYRGKGVLEKMMKFTRCEKFESLCPENARFNDYYRKMGWMLVNCDKGVNYWEFVVKE